MKFFVSSDNFWYPFMEHEAIYANERAIHCLKLKNAMDQAMYGAIITIPFDNFFIVTRWYFATTSSLHMLIIIEPNEWAKIVHRATPSAIIIDRMHSSKF